MTAALDRARAVPSVRADIRGYWVSQERLNNAPLRWRGVQMMTLTGADSGALLALAGELQQGGLVMSGMSYDLAPETTRAAEDELTAEALQRLRDRANRVAAAMGLSVRSFRDVRVGNVGGDRPPRPVMMREAMAASTMPPPVAEPGETTVQVTVEADVVLGPATRP
jgi:predicted secreted protein